jgi:hypothetical protein
MTYDKIVHYIGKDIAEFIGMQSAEKLQEMKKQLTEEFKNNTIPNELKFKYCIELELINNLLK